MQDYCELLALSNDATAKVDPLVLNLLVAKSIPRLESLDIPHYQNQADEWAALVRSRLPRLEKFFWQTPQD